MPNGATAATSPVADSALVEIVDATLSAVDMAAHNLPDHDSAAFPAAISALLADIQRLQASTESALRSPRGVASELAALSRIRKVYDELMLQAAASPHASTGQRLYACRSRAGLTSAETAAALGLSPEELTGIEGGVEPDADVAARIDDLMRQLA